MNDFSKKTVSALARMSNLVTKRREGNGKFGPRYRILINLELSPFTVEKSIPPKYRHPQLWDVIEGDDPDGVLFDAHSLEGALAVVATIAKAVLTSGDVGPMPSGPNNERFFRWPDLDPFTRGYIEALLSSPIQNRHWRSIAFSDLAPETLARVIEDCAAAVGIRIEPQGLAFTDTVQGGHLFWEGRQTNNFMGSIGFPPLTVTLGDDGKVRFA